MKLIKMNFFSNIPIKMIITNSNTLYHGSLRNIPIIMLHESLLLVH